MAPVRAASALDRGDAGEGIMSMRTLFKPLVLGSMPPVGPGCQFLCHVGQNMCNEPLLACDEKAT